MRIKLFWSIVFGTAVVASAQGYQDGVDNYNADRKDIAKEILTNTLNNPSTNKAVSYYYLGNIAFSENNLTAAKENFDKGVAADPSNQYNYIGLGEVALKQGNKAEAKKLFDQAMKSDKKNTALMAAVARSYWNVDPVAYEKDINSLITKAFKESKNSESAIYMLQGDMVAKTDPGQAAGKYEMAIEQDKQKDIVNREAYVKYAHVYNRHNPQLVTEKLEELNELEPNSGLAQRELAEVYYDNGQFGRAWKSYEKYVQNPNHFRRDEQRYAGLLTSAKEYNESLKWADKVLAQDPTAYQMYRIKMLDYKGLKNDSLTLVNGDLLFSYPGADLVLNDYIVYAEALCSVNRGQDAVKVLEGGLVKFADHEKVNSLLPKLTVAYRTAGDNDKAIETQLRYLDSGAAQPGDYYQMFSSYFNKGRSAQDDVEKHEAFAMAKKYIDKAIELAPSHAPYVFQALSLDFYNNNAQLSNDGIEIANRVLGLTEGKSDKSSTGIRFSTYFILANNYANTDKEKALEYITKALEIQPENASALDMKARLEK